MTYDPNFYDIINSGSIRSARTVVPVLADLIDPKSVLDLGCGEGAWLSVFAEHGFSVHGVDGAYVNQERLLIERDHFIPFDLSTGAEIDLNHRFGLAISLEVAEHLPASRAGWFVDHLCLHSDVVLFSAAIPGQGGVGHVHERWQDYWVSLFEARGYRCSSAFKLQFWDQAPDEIENWYAQNMMLCVAESRYEKDRSFDQWFDHPCCALHRTVHPVLWESRL